MHAEAALGFEQLYNLWARASSSQRAFMSPLSSSLKSAMKEAVEELIEEFADTKPPSNPDKPDKPDELDDPECLFVGTWTYPTPKRAPAALKRMLAASKRRPTKPMVTQKTCIGEKKSEGKKEGDGKSNSLLVEDLVPALAGESDTPRGYVWADWNHPIALLQEEAMAQEYEITDRKRGPVPPPRGPTSWRDIPFNFKENAWIYTDRRQLPASYRFDDWWAEDALKEEARLAKEHMIPWSLRGPPDGPGPGKRKFWRSLKWKPHKMQWKIRRASAPKDRNHHYFRNRKPIFFVPRRW